jgi:hypothetical protein
MYEVESSFGGKNLLLDGYENLVAVWSNARLRSDYEGNSLLYKNWSTNAEAEIGWIGNKIDVESAPLGVNVGVSVQYDQSGNGFDIAESETLRQFRIKAADNSFKTVNGYPVLEGKPLGQLSRLRKLGLGTFPTTYSIVMTIKNLNLAAGVSRFILDRYSNAETGNDVYVRIQPDNDFGLFAGTERTPAVSTVDTWLLVMVVTTTTTDFTRAISSVSDDELSNSVGNTIMNGISLGASRNETTTNTFDGYIMDTIIFDGDMRDDEDLINGLKSKIGI